MSMSAEKDNILTVLSNLKHSYSKYLKTLGLCGAYANNSDSDCIEVCFEFSDELNERIKAGDEKTLFFWELLEDMRNELNFTFEKEVDLIQISAVNESTNFMLEGAIYV